MAFLGLRQVVMSLSHSVGVYRAPIASCRKHVSFVPFVNNLSTKAIEAKSRNLKGACVTSPIRNIKFDGKPTRSQVLAYSTGSEGPYGKAQNIIVKWYLDKLERQPIITKSITCAILNALGDIFSQLFIEHATSINLERVKTFGLLGLVLVGPALHFWYTFLNRIVPARSPRGTLMQLALDQLVFAPFFLGTILSVLFAMEGKSHLIRSKLEQDLFSTVRANWLLWVPAQFFNFRYVPPNLQVLMSNVVALLWNTYMSYVSHK